MPLQPHRRVAATVELLREAFHSGRSVTLHVTDLEEPLSGCVSHIVEGAAAGEYVFSAFVGRERLVISGAEALIERSSAAHDHC
jgi:hypothetical protein